MDRFVVVTPIVVVDVVVEGVLLVGGYAVV